VTVIPAALWELSRSGESRAFLLMGNVVFSFAKQDVKQLSVLPMMGLNPTHARKLALDMTVSLEKQGMAIAFPPEVIGVTEDEVALLRELQSLAGPDVIPELLALLDRFVIEKWIPA
jgi:hypothetical protein